MLINIIINLLTDHDGYIFNDIPAKFNLSSRLCLSHALFSPLVHPTEPVPLAFTLIAQYAAMCKV